MEPTQAAMEASLNFLTETDEEFARACALYEGLSNQLKTIKAMAFNQSRESSATAREQAAIGSMAYQQHLQQMAEAHIDMLTLKEKRNTAEITIRCWQCLNAARYKGSVT